MKKLTLFFFSFFIFIAFSNSISAFNDFEHEMNYSPKTNDVTITIHHSSVFSKKENYKITAMLNGLNINFTETNNGKSTTLVLKGAKKNASNSLTINVLNNQNQSIASIKEDFFVNNFNSKALYHFFNPSYDASKSQLTFSTYIKKSDVGKFAVRASINDKITDTLSFLSETAVPNTSYVLQKYALPLSTGSQVVEIFHPSTTSTKVLIKKMTVSPSSSTSFPDVESNFWAYNPITWSKSLGLTVGGFQNKFHPAQNITRGEAVTILSRLMNLDKNNGTKHTYTDINNHWAAHNIANLSELKIVSGYSNGTFKPDNAITRAETAALISNFLIYNQYPFFYKQGTPVFNDVFSYDWYNRSVISLNSMKIVSGYLDKSFKPNNPISRAEFISIIKNFNDDLFVNILD